MRILGRNVAEDLLSSKCPLRDSPDGRFLALVSDESGQNEVYVHAYPDAHRRWTISSAGGTEPTWSADGSELFYRNGDAMMVVALETEPEFDPGVPRALFRKAFRMSPVLTNYDVSSDGQRFVGRGWRRNDGDPRRGELVRRARADRAIAQVTRDQLSRLRDTTKAWSSRI